MQALQDLLPVLLFFGVYKTSGIYAATAALLVATVLQVAWQYFRHRKVSGMLLASAAIVLVFGGLTLLIHDDRFIVWKPSVLYLLLALAFALSTFIGRQPLLQRTLGHALRTERRIWIVATLHWSVFFVVLAVVNGVFVLHYSRDAWATWKLATVGVVLVFAVLQMLWLSRHAEPVEPGP
ncbi:MAG: inner membrane-spanning protein YciB [Gammaproteobacteria bacterium]